MDTRKEFGFSPVRAAVISREDDRVSEKWESKEKVALAAEMTLVASLVAGKLSHDSSLHGMVV